VSARPKPNPVARFADSLGKSPASIFRPQKSIFSKPHERSFAVSLPGQEILQHLPDYGFDICRSTAVYRAYVEDGVLPKGGGPHNRPLLGSEHLSRLIIGILCGETIKKISHASGVYAALQDEGGRRLDDVVAGWIESFKSAKAAFDRKDANEDTLTAMVALRSRIVIDTDFPRATIVTETNDGTIERVFGPIKDPESTFVRVSNTSTIPGAVLYRLACGIHFNIWS
jgi:hypothetical protein